jgi:hypothetical protein
MKCRPFYLLAIVLLTAVLPVSITSQTRAARAVSAAARASGTQDDGQRTALEREAHSKFQDAGRLSLFAMGIFVCGVGAWALSLARREGGLQGVPLLLTAVGVLVQLLLV